MNNNTIEQNWTTIIRPKSNLFDLHLSDLWKYRDLIKMFVIRDFATFYKQTILGPVWFIIQPLMTSLMFTMIFGKVAKISTDEIPQLVFYLSGVINWGYFSECLTKTSETFTSNAGMFGKVYFPRLTVPIAIIITNMLRYFIQFAIFISVFLFFIYNGEKIHPNLMILLTPVILLYMAVMSLGFGIWISSLTTKYRDLRFALPFVVHLWMYASPIVYPFSIIPEKYRMLVAINPFVQVIEVFRYAFLGTGIIKLQYIIISVSITLFILFSGIILFNRIEKRFMDTV